MEVQNFQHNSSCWGISCAKFKPIGNNTDITALKQSNEGQQEEAGEYKKYGEQKSMKDIPVLPVDQKMSKGKRDSTERTKLDKNKITCIIGEYIAFQPVAQNDP